MVKADRVWRNASLATAAGGGYGIVEDGVVASGNGRIIWAGSAADAPDFDAPDTVDCGGRWITPGLIDAHTHLVYAGNRANEFEMRLEGKSYADIAKAGGGIVSTVSAVRAASEDDLVNQSLPRLDALLADGVTTVEIKSGYGLDTDSECKMLRAAGRLTLKRAVRVKRTFLGAHALPPEFAGDKDGYIETVCCDQLPAAAAEGLADAVDGFCEGIAFSANQIERVFEAAKAAGLPVKLHAEQLTNAGGTRLAARFGALSVDHLEYANDEDITAMAESGSVAMILPGAFYYLGETTKPPVDAMRRAGVPMAVATDCNPGSSPVNSLRLAMNMAAVLFGMTPEETFAGATIHAARALGIAGECGSLETGKACDLAIWSITHPRDLTYEAGASPLWRRVFRGNAA
ncbi:MAG: imidazolonepropionase [Rhodospirillales bacterium]